MLDRRSIRRSRQVRRRRPWNGVSWWFSLILVVPLLIIGYKVVSGDGGSDGGNGHLTIQVTDSYTGQALAGAQVLVGNQQLAADKHGKIEAEMPAGPTVIEVRHDNYESKWGQVDKNSARSQKVDLRPTMVRGVVLDAASNRPIEGASVSAFGVNGANPAKGTTDADGRFTLTNVPSGARIHVDAGPYGVHEEDVGKRTEIDFKLKQSVVTGSVANAAGDPIQGAVISAGSAKAVSDAKGAYRLNGAPDSGQLLFQASGYEDLKLPLPANHQANAKMDQVKIKAIYIEPETAGNADRFGHLVDLVDKTELNAMVVDIKEGSVFYDTGVQFFKDAGTVQPAYNVQQLVKTLHDHHIYAIARLVVFNDPQVAGHYPDLAVKDVNGGVWRDSNGNAWVNPFKQQVWQPNIDLAVEAAKLGFDEIQFDYIRFPSDGNLKTADFGQDYTADARVGAITGYLKEADGPIHAAGAKVAVDIFGITTIYDDDEGIGQRLRDIAPLVDYLCPMLYPSHFDSSAINGIDDPNDHPYDVMKIGLQGAEAKMPGMTLKLRPWLQDFKYPGLRAYTTADVLAQIKAADEEGTSGWMVWNAGSDFHEDVFKPQT